MLFTARYLAVAALASALAGALPLDVVPRAKSYAVVNVDGGGSPTKAPAKPTTVLEEKTTTVEVVNPGPTVTATVVQPAPTPTVTSSSSATSSSKGTSTRTSTATTTTAEKPKTSVVTVTITPSPKSTEYYDDGMWHTKYAIKSDAAPAATQAPSAGTGV